MLTDCRASLAMTLGDVIAKGVSPLVTLRPDEVGAKDLASPTHHLTLTGVYTWYTLTTQEHDMADLEKTVRDIETGDAWKEDDQAVQVEVKRPLDKVIPVRLPADKWEQIREEARDLGVGPTTLARMWILERLRSKRRT